MKVKKAIKGISTLPKLVTRVRLPSLALYGENQRRLAFGRQ